MEFLFLIGRRCRYNTDILVFCNHPVAFLVVYKWHKRSLSQFISFFGDYQFFFCK